MHRSTHDHDDIVRRGEEIFERVGATLGPEHDGDYVVIDVESGEYEIDSDHLAASDRAAAKHPNAPLYAVRVGRPTVGRIGMRGPTPKR